MHGQQSGFSLPSLLLGLTLLSTLASITLPQTQRWLDNRHAQADRATLAALIEYARLSTLLTRQPLILCPLTSALAESSSPTGGLSVQVNCGSDWARGALLMSAEGTPFRVRRFIPSSRIHLEGPAMPLVFRTDTTTNLLNATFTFTGRTSPRYSLILNRAGRTRYEVSPNANIAQIIDATSRP